MLRFSECRCASDPECTAEPTYAQVDLMSIMSLGRVLKGEMK